MLRQLGPALRIALVLTVLTGLIYPAVVTGLCQMLFHRQANGSLIVREGRIIGSSLIGQRFTSPEYFHPRPSAAGREGYDASSSGGSNLGPTSRELINRVKRAVKKFRKENPDFHGPVPSDIVTESGSGLDPHISPESAYAQAFRIAKARRVPLDKVNRLIAQCTELPSLAILGDARVNVLRLNLELDRHFHSHGNAFPGL